MKALLALSSPDAICASLLLLCEQDNLSIEIRNQVQLALVDLREQALPVLAHRLDTATCSSQTAAALFARIARRTPEELPSLCRSLGPSLCGAAASGLAVSGHPDTASTLVQMYQATDSCEGKAAVLAASCPISSTACPQLLRFALAPDSPRALVLSALGSLRSIRAKELVPETQRWLLLDDPELLLAVLETLAATGSHGLEQTLFDLMPSLPQALKDPLLMALAAGDSDTVRPLLQRTFASQPPSTPEQRRIAQWLLADSPDILFRGNSPETTPVYASAQPATTSVCRLTLRSLEGMRVAVDGKLRLVCPDATSKTLAFEHPAFREDGTLEFPCLCPDGTRPQATWITVEDALLEIQWPKQP